MAEKMKMTKLFATAVVAFASAFAFSADAQSNAEYHLKNMTIDRTGEFLKVSVDVNPAEYRLKTNQRLEITPVLKSNTSNDSIVFPGFSIAGRNSWYNAERSGKFDGKLMRSGHGDVYEYEAHADWADWMEYSRLELRGHSTGCCGVATAPVRELPVAELDFRPEKFEPMFHYKAPVAEASKMRRIEGKAFINFPVNRTEIYPDYMVNPVELKKITSSIDTVRFNPDATVKSITLTGFASPEGPYQNNVRLAKGRTEALRDYVMALYTFPSSVFHANSVPEDWEGLREAVANSVLEDRAAILDFIDNGNVPIERRNDELRKKFPKSYAYLLKNVYPSLRHTNYAIDYELRTFTDVEEIKKVIKERPQNLSLNEFFLAANSYAPGSDESKEVYELAAIYYPNSDVANLNAANVAIAEGDYLRARMLLNRLADSAEKDYALSLLMALDGDYENARVGMEKSLKGGVEEAREAIGEIDRISKKSSQITFSPEFKD